MADSIAGTTPARYRFDAEGIRFHAQPGGKPETIFPATKHEPGLIVFEQPGHDFPKRVSYRREADGRAARPQPPAAMPPPRMQIFGF